MEKVVVVVCCGLSFRSRSTGAHTIEYLCYGQMDDVLVRNTFYFSQSAWRCIHISVLRNFDVCLPYGFVEPDRLGCVCPRITYFMAHANAENNNNQHTHAEMSSHHYIYTITQCICICLVRYTRTPHWNIIHSFTRHSIFQCPINIKLCTASSDGLVNVSSIFFFCFWFEQSAERAAHPNNISHTNTQTYI